MKNLPVLSSDFAYFSWDSQFGTATSEQLQNAYTALTTNGLTTKFHRNVWNDIVDRLNKAITQAGLSWNTTYGTATETKINEKYGILTARKFNAVTVNIESILNNYWRWEKDTMFTGYLGRSRFYGVTEREDNADYLYGAYILELVRVLNTFIAVLKNEANFADFIIKEISHTPTDTLLRANKSAPMFFAKSSLTGTNTTALSRASRPMYTTLYSSSKYSSEALKRPSSILESSEVGKSLTNTILSPKIRAKLDYIGASNAPYKVDAKSLGAKRLGSLTKALSKYISSMNKPKVARAGYETIIYAPYDSELNNPIAQVMDYEEAILSKDISEANTPRVTQATSENIATSSNVIDVIVGRPKFPTAHEVDKTTSNTNTSVIKSNPLTIEDVANTCEKSLMAKGNLLRLSASVKSRTKSSVYLTFDIVENAWAVQHGDNLFIYQIYDGYKDESDLYIDTEYWLAPIQNGTDLFIRQLYDNDEVKGE